ncbi:MAG: lyase [candidate division Zixibacteria bacterium]|nr:lyase [Candidatus Dadabacteria bacterium]NIW44008.1 lyase [Gammaproteobacteria bacterium]NIX59108.1 lyase [candidate division Zixibacteria bacterium]
MSNGKEQMNLLRFLIPLFLSLLLSPVITLAGDVEIKEWKVPYEKTRPRDPFVDAKGRVWFCGQGGAYLAYLVPETGEFRKYDLGKGEGPHNLIIDKEGFVWYAANTKPFIGKLNPDNGDVVKYEMPGTDATDPHTLVFNSAGDIWFTLQSSNMIGKLKVKTGEVTLIPIPVKRARPYGIKVDAQDRPWVALFGTNKLASVDPETMALSIHELSRSEARPRRLVISKDGNIWYGDYNEGKLGRFQPADGSVTEWQLPGGEDARPYGMVKDDKETIWIGTRQSPNWLVGFSIRQEKVISVTDIPNARGSVRHMYFHPPTREIWFGEDTNYIGRARAP